MDKKTFLGVHLTPADYRAFRIAAAEQGKAMAELLRELALGAIGGAKASKKKGGAK